MDYQKFKTIYATYNFVECNKLIHNGWVLITIDKINNDGFLPELVSKFILGNENIIPEDEIKDFLTTPSKYTFDDDDCVPF